MSKDEKERNEVVKKISVKALQLPMVNPAISTCGDQPVF